MIEVDDQPGLIQVKPHSDEPRLQVRLKLTNHEHLLPVIERVRRMFDLSADPLQIANHLARDPRLKPLLEKRGLRVPGVWDGFELAVRAILGQQLTAQDPRPLISRLVRNFGRPVQTSVKGLTHLFPRPEVLTHADLSRAGIRGACAAAVRSLSQALSKREIEFEAAKTLEGTLSHLRAVRGMGNPRAPTSPCVHVESRIRFPSRMSDCAGALELAEFRFLRPSSCGWPIAGGRGAHTPLCICGQPIREAAHHRRGRITPTSRK
jgi:AraC family transcriptional regulator of adaptative response / DNA-3-methyladenine glycosylase II